MKNLNPRLCPSCSSSFVPLPQHPDQKFCSKIECQKYRKNRTTLSKMKTDSAYIENQANANKRWRQKNPDYQRNYRRNKKKVYDNIDLSKNNVLINLPILSGTYQLTVIESTEKMAVLIVKLELISNS